MRTSSADGGASRDDVGEGVGDVIKAIKYKKRNRGLCRRRSREYLVKGDAKEKIYIEYTFSNDLMY